MMDSFTKRYSLSYMRALACIAIIVLHSVYTANELFLGTITPVQNIVSRCIENNMMWAVPCFLMVTGTLLLDKNKNVTYKKLYQKYVLRIVLALILFITIFCCFDVVMNKENISFGLLKQILYKIYTGQTWSHLWYLYLLIGLYAMLPFYKTIINHCSEKEWRYLVMIYILFISILPLTKIWGITSGFYLPVSLIYPLYLFCGYLLHKDVIHLKRWQGKALFIVSIIFISILTIVRWTMNWEMAEQLWQYASPAVILQSCGFFVMMDVEQEKKPKIIGKLLLKIDEYSFGIYLIHVMFVRLIFRYMAFNPYMVGKGWSLIVAFIIIMAASYLSAWILKKVPGVRKIV